MKILDYLTLSRSHLMQTTKKILSQVYCNNLNEIISLLYEICKKQMPFKENILKEYENVISNKCNFIDINSEFYPKLLKTIRTAPVLLTFKGNKDIFLKNSIAVVGSRKLEDTDIQIINNVVKIINYNEYPVISGFAHGSDIIAHLQSVKTGTMAVLPCGISNCYPKDHINFIDKIIDFQGCVLSEYSFIEPPKQQNFIQRNRIISGICDAIFIARAREIKSGSISSANFANKFNRHVYTVLFEGENKGNQFLLKNELAKEIKDLENFTFNLIEDIANNQLLLEQNSKNNCNSNFSTNYLFVSNIDSKNIQREVKNIIKYSKNKPIEKNLLKLFEICKNEIKTNEINIMNCLLKEIFCEK